MNSNRCCMASIKNGKRPNQSQCLYVCRLHHKPRPPFSARLYPAHMHTPTHTRTREQPSPTVSSSEPGATCEVMEARESHHTAKEGLVRSSFEVICPKHAVSLHLDMCASVCGCCAFICLRANDQEWLKREKALFLHAYSAWHNIVFTFIPLICRTVVFRRTCLLRTRALRPYLSLRSDFHIMDSSNIGHSLVPVCSVI